MNNYKTAIYILHFIVIFISLHHPIKMKAMLKTVFFVACQLIVLSLTATGGVPNYHSVTPKEGDGIYSLLRRYDLQNPCDQAQFLKINDLKKTSSIHKHVQYQLPVYIYQYDGKSIRSTIGVNDWDKAVRIKKYNDQLRKRGLRKSTYQSSKLLWVPYRELHCESTTSDQSQQTDDTPVTAASSSSAVKTVELFGSKYKDLKIEDNSLKNKVVYVVSGHGGPDPGARCLNCPSTLCEDEYAYDIALRLARNLMQHGATVHMIVQDENDGIRDDRFLKCDKDEKVNGKALPLKQKARLVQRAAEVNKLYRKYKKQGKTDQVAIFLHVDSNNEHKRQDVYFYHHKNSKSGKKVAKNIRDTFDKKYKKYQKNRGYKGTVKTRGLYVLNYTQPTSVFVELANIRNKRDHKRLLLNTNRQAVANWLYEGLIK